MPELLVIGTSHHTAPVEVREGLALAPDAVHRLLAQVRADHAWDEALLLSTCNRTEFYAVPGPAGPADPADPAADLLARLGRVRPSPPPALPDGALYRRDDREAVRHLFRVAASLDSQIVGETEILGQVKTAYRLAVEARTAGFLLNRLLHRAFRVGKRVRTETALGQGSAGVPQAAVELAAQVFADLAQKTVLLVGAGRTAEAVARALLVRGPGRLIVANRTLYRAQQLALDLAGESAGPSTHEAVGLDDLPSAVARADLVIASTGATEPVLTHDALAPVLARRTRPLMVIDIAVPRDVDVRLGRLEHVYLYDIDDLDRLVERNLAERRREIPRAEAIVDDEVAEFERWLASRQVAPTIRLLRRRLRGIRHAQIERYGKQFAGADRDQLEAFTRSMAKRILHHPIALLKHLATDGATSERLATVDLVRRLFDLDALENEGPDADDEAEDRADDAGEMAGPAADAQGRG